MDHTTITDELGPGPATPSEPDRAENSNGNGWHQQEPADDPVAHASPEVAPPEVASPELRADAQAPLVPPAPAGEARPAGPRRARIIALANQKGGVGKTTTTVSLGAALAEAGQKVLLVDFDPQGGCGLGLGIEPGDLEASIYDALLDRNAVVENIIIATGSPGLDLLPSNIDLSAAELQLVSEVAREQSLQRVLEPLRVQYDFILIDCPPSLGLLTINALTAADGVIVPLETEYYALRGMGMLMDSIGKIRERLNPGLAIDGILATMYDSRTVHGKEVLARVRDAFADRLFDTVIRKTIKFAEAPVAGESILSYAPDSSGAAAYRSVAKEVMDRVKASQSAGS